MPTSLRLALVAAGLLLSAQAFATTPLPVPEPGILELLGAGAVAGIVVWVRKRRK